MVVASLASIPQPGAACSVTPRSAEGQAAPHSDTPRSAHVPGPQTRHVPAASAAGGRPGQGVVRRRQIGDVVAAEGRVRAVLRARRFTAGAHAAGAAPRDSAGALGGGDRGPGACVPAGSGAHGSRGPHPLECVRACVCVCVCVCV